jgi:hypothetical protein
VPVAVFCLVFYLQKIHIKRSPNAAKLFGEFFGPEDIQRTEEVPERGPEVGSTHHGVPEAHGAPWWVMPSSETSCTASLLYKYPNIPETLGESTKINSSRRKFQNHQIQSRHHQRGVHHVHWCLSDDA